ncbi:peptidoglycan-binding protein [Streptomyces sp. NPDC005951]|uniref:peptidoglycan-binding protein n=1 Tax=Streptomyces sp. NPDC005951 TaxID=3154573 RepID=UPI0034093298
MLIKSPAQVAAETAAPAPDVLTAPVVRKVLAQSVVTRGKVSASQRTEIAMAETPKDVGRAVVTKIEARTGQTPKFGQVLVEVSGRPIFMLQGDLPAYRDLMRGLSGPDVSQLQRALAGVGYSSNGDAPGVFGPGTEQAVIRFYRAIGYSPVTMGSEPPEEPQDGQKPPQGQKAGDRATQRGSVVPLSEVAFIGSSTARIEAVEAKVGSEAEGTLLSVTSGSLMIDGAVASYEKGLVRVGQSVQILDETTGKQATGTVTAVAKAPTKAEDGEPEHNGDSYAVRIKPAGKLPADFNGAEVRLTIVAASSEGKVLAVPSSAISAGADGLTTVTVRTGKKERRVAVQVGMTGDGYVQVILENSGSLSLGDRVVVGVQPPGTAGRP